MQVAKRKQLAPSSDTQTYTIEEVAVHDGSQGTYWTVLYNKVYDITEYLDKHPGGEIIRFCAGRDGTELMESYHSTKSHAVVLHTIKKYYIGDIAVPMNYGDDRFFVTLRERCDKKLKEVGWGRHFYEGIALAEVLITSILYLWITYWIIQTGSYWWSFILGIVTSRMGFFMHMGNHRAISSNKYINMWCEKLMDLIGGSSFIWTYEHAIAHHISPNVLGVDNDTSIGNPYIRFNPGIEWRWHHRFQAPLIILAISIGIAKWVISDIFDHFKGVIGSQKFFVRPKDWAILFGFKGSYILLHIILPIYFQGWKVGLTCAAINFVVSAYYLESIFIVNHIQEDLVPEDDLHWAEKQVVGSADWAVGSHFWNWFSGGLNHQIAHHLFPSISHWCYPVIAPVIQETCKEFDLPFYAYDSFAEAYIKMYKYLHRLGKPPSDPEHLSHKSVYKRGKLTKAQKEALAAAQK